MAVNTVNYLTLVNAAENRAYNVDRLQVSNGLDKCPKFSVPATVVGTQNGKH